MSAGRNLLAHGAACPRMWALFLPARWSSSRPRPSFTFFACFALAFFLTIWMLSNLLWVCFHRCATISSSPLGCFPHSHVWSSWPLPLRSVDLAGSEITAALFRCGCFRLLSSIFSLLCMAPRRPLFNSPWLPCLVSHGNCRAGAFVHCLPCQPEDYLRLRLFSFSS